MRSDAPVVAGVDGSPSSLAAARHAAELAVRRRAPLECLCAYQIPVYGYPPMGGVDPAILADEQIREGVERMLAGIEQDLRQAYPELRRVTVRELPGGPAMALIDRSQEALATVVGCRGKGGFAELLLGSVSAQVAAHAHGPVIVVRPPVPDEDTPTRSGLPLGPQVPLGPVLVGVDGSPESAAALAYAAEEAQSREVPLDVIHAYWTPLHPVTRDPEHEGVMEARQVLDHAVAPIRERWPQVQMDIRAVHTNGVEQTMIEASKDVGLTVIGCRGRGGFTGALLGSISRALVHHAHSPVAVIHRHDLER
ncbi:MAG: universal stress protein [Hamadaea sp.]|nr:universal stress protein [Hamadaea sp.]